MFCRGCAYDLRGQQTPRCPECGTEFDFDDPATFFTQTPTRARRLLRWYRSRRKLWTRVLTLGMFVSLLYAAKEFPNPWTDYSIHNNNDELLALVAVWLSELEENPDASVDISALARWRIGPGLSPRTERGAIWARSAAHRASQLGFGLVLIAIAYVTLLSVLHPSRFRRGRFVTVACLALMLIPWVYEGHISSALWPLSYAYLDDFVLVDDLRDAGPIPLDERIVAYDLCSFQGDRRRYVVFGSRRDTLLDRKEAERLFREQGIPLPPTE